MRALLCAALLLFAVPAASAHGDPPEMCSYDTCEDPPPCPQLPLYDAAVCQSDRAIEDAGHWSDFALAYADYLAHQLRCHIIGGPACDPPW